jgi:hypothetical protein
MSIVQDGMSNRPINQRMFNKEFSELDHPKLKGYDKWTINCEIHVENYAINFHAQFASSEKFGTVVAAIRGTEFDPNERKLEMAKGWFTNLNAVQVMLPYPKESEAMVHKGFLDNYLEAKESFSRQCSKYLDSGYKLIVTGYF